MIAPSTLYVRPEEARTKTRVIHHSQPRKDPTRNGPRPRRTRPRSERASARRGSSSVFKKSRLLGGMLTNCLAWAGGKPPPSTPPQMQACRAGNGAPASDHASPGEVRDPLARFLRRVRRLAVEFRRQLRREGRQYAGRRLPRYTPHRRQPPVQYRASTRCTVGRDTPASWGDPFVPLVARFSQRISMRWRTPRPGARNAHD